MLSPIVIFSIVVIIGIVLYIFLSNLNLLPFQKNNISAPLFMKTEDIIILVSSQIGLNEEEERNLSDLLNIVSGNRLHMAFEDETIIKKWLTNTVRAIHATNYFTAPRKLELEFTAYDIFRRIDNHRKITRPLVRYISDVPLKQTAELIIKNENPYLVEISSSSLSSLSVLMSVKNTRDNKEAFFMNKDITLSFWKFMDARYQLSATIKHVQKKSTTGDFVLTLQNIRNIKCVQVRQFPRSTCEFPVKFRQEIFSTDPNSGSIVESYDALKLGIIDNISLNGCRIISFSPVPEESLIYFEFPIFNSIIPVHATVRQILRSSNSYSLHLEFEQGLSLANLVYIYRYIFAEKNTENN